MSRALHTARSAWAVQLDRRMERRVPRRNDESGAVLVLALIFLISVSLIVTALLTWSGTSVRATGNFQDERNLEYGATDAVNLAIQNTRYAFDYGNTGTPGNPNPDTPNNPYSPNNPLLNNPTPALCSSYQVPNSTASVDVYCSMVWQPYSASTREFTYSACSTTSPTNANPGDCAAQPLLQALVAFDDYPSGVAFPSPSPSQCLPILKQTSLPGADQNGSCGVSMTQISWQWNPVVPAITNVSPSSGSSSGGATVTILGTGFTSGETVNFVEQPQELATGAYNPPVSAPIIAATPSCPVATCVQVTSPAITVGKAYFVEVSTPGGTSQTAPTSSFVPTFTYSPGAPTVTGLAGTTAGSITGNTLVTIQGTGFWNAPNNTFPAQAFFCPTGAGTPVSTSECSGGVGCKNAAGQSISCVVSVSPPTATAPTTFTMNALSPAVSAAGTYYIQVEVFNVYSVQTGAVFTYSVQAPLVVSLNPTSGVSGAQVTIAGANFISGSTVGFCAETNGNPTNANCPTNTSSQTMGTVPASCWQTGGGCSATQIIVSVPTLAAGTYYPVVTLPSQYPGIPASQPYNEPADIFTYT
jgi:hypothetical protein